MCNCCLVCFMVMNMFVMLILVFGNLNFCVFLRLYIFLVFFDNFLIKLIIFVFLFIGVVIVSMYRFLNLC